MYTRSKCSDKSAPMCRLVGAFATSGYGKYSCAGPYVYFLVGVGRGDLLVMMSCLDAYSWVKILKIIPEFRILRLTI